MKKMILIAALISAATVAKADEQHDTVLSVINPSSVTITETPEGFGVSVTTVTSEGESRSDYSESFDNPVRIDARRWRSRISLAPSGDSDWDLTVGGPGIGWVNACGQPDGMGVEMGKSLEISWLNALAVTYRLPLRSSWISLGFGFDWRNYRISTGASRFVPDGNGGVEIGEYPEGVTPKGSRLKVFSMGVPLLWHQQLPFRIFGQSCVLWLGAVFNYNSHASMKTKWELPDGSKAEQKVNHIGHRRFTVDFIGMLRVWYGINLYVRYSPNSVLRGAGQPRFNPLSTGLILFY